MIDLNGKEKYQAKGDKSLEWKYHALQHFEVKASGPEWVLDHQIHCHLEFDLVSLKR